MNKKTQIGLGIGAIIIVAAAAGAGGAAFTKSRNGDRNETATASVTVATVATVATTQTPTTPPPATTTPATTISSYNQALGRLLQDPAVDWTTSDLATINLDDREDVYIIRTRDLNIPAGWDRIGNPGLLELGYSWCDLLEEYRGDSAAIILDFAIEASLEFSDSEASEYMDMLTTTGVYAGVLCPEWHAASVRSIHEANS